MLNFDSYPVIEVLYSGKSPLAAKGKVSLAYCLKMIVWFYYTTGAQRRRGIFYNWRSGYHGRLRL
jgi:adenosylmethionine-8-amino-7-oxononanoate aminotransferase